MFASAKGAAASRDHGACSGCSLCLLVCPVWRRTHDPRMTPEGRAKALQHGATPMDIADSVHSCTLCGACEPVCPEEIDLVGMTLDLRTRLADPQAVQAAMVRMGQVDPASLPAGAARPVLLPGPGLRANARAIERVCDLLGCAPCMDGGDDIIRALEAGMPIPKRRLDRFLDGLRAARTIVVEDGFWLRHLRGWLAGARLMALGEALNRIEAVRRALQSTDLYIIEPRAYHGDYERLVKHYDRLRAERRCAFNLDLQRIAIPAAGQAEWILKGLHIQRIVVERMEDALAFEADGLIPVVHLAELADHPGSMSKASIDAHG